MKHTDLSPTGKRTRNSTPLGADSELSPMPWLTTAYSTTAHAAAILLLLLGTLMICGTALAQELDPAFSSDGLMTFDVGLNGGSKDDLANDGVLQTDNKIVVVGSAEFSGFDTDAFVARVGTDGLLDNSFANGGIFTLAIDAGGDKQDLASSVALLDDGRILVGGFAHTDSEVGYWLRRLNSNGGIDASFLATALVTEASVGVSVADLLIEPSGTFLVLVLRLSAGIGENSVYRYSADGATRTLVHTFSSSHHFFEMARDASGTIWLGGRFFNVNNFDIGLGKIDGASVSTFSRALDLGGTNSDLGLGIVLQGSKPVVVGKVEHASGYAVVALRFNSDGTNDNSFGTLGVATLFQSDNFEASASSVAVAHGEKLIAAGSQMFTGSLDSDQFVAGLTSDGSLDPGFGPGGGMFGWFYDLGGSQQDRSATVHVDTLGRILITGDAVRSATDTDITVTRLLPPALFADGFESGDTTAWQ